MQTANTAVAIGGAGASSAAALGVAAGLIPAAAVPFIGPAIAGVTLLVSALIKNSGCGQTCVVTSQYANQAGDILAQNIKAYFDQPVRTKSSQQVALSNFDKVWASLVSTCDHPEFGDAGKRCVSDRQAGACVWRQTADKVPAWGTPAAGECWNYFSGMRDPIANDPGVVPDESVATTTGNAVSTAVSDVAGNALVSAGVSSNYVVPVLIGAAVLAVWVAIK